MVELVHQFTYCNHCKNRWPGLRYDCPYCGWPREHTDVTPAPTSGSTPVPISVGAAPQTSEPTPDSGPAFYDPITGEPIMPIPQGPKMVPREPTWEELAAAAKAPVTRAMLAQPRPAPMLRVADDVAAPPVTIATQQPHHVAALTSAVPASTELPLDAFEAPKPRKRKGKSA